MYTTIACVYVCDQYVSIDRHLNLREMQSRFMSIQMRMFIVITQAHSHLRTCKNT